MSKEVITQYPHGGLIPLAYHVTLLDDKNRCEFFLKSIENLMKPDWVVVDLGSGTGILSYFAANHCSKVYAVEHDPYTFKALQRIIHENNLSHKITPVYADASQFVPPEPINAIICEMLHVGLCKEQQVPVLNAMHATLQKHYPKHAPMVFPNTALNAIQLIQHDFSRYGFEARFPQYLNPNAPNNSITLSPLISYWVAQFHNTLDPVINNHVSATINQNGKLNAVQMFTIASMSEDVSENTYNPQWIWGLCGFLFPLEKEFQVQPMDEVMLNIKYTAGQPIEHVMIDVTIKGETIRNIL